MGNRPGPIRVLLRGTGSMIKTLALAFSEPLRTSATKVFGTRINRQGFAFLGNESRKGQVMELRCGPMAAIISVILQMGSKRATAPTIGQMVHAIVESGIQMKCRVKAHSPGQMADYSRVILGAELCMVTACIHGLMAVNMTEPTTTTRSMVRVLIHTLMAQSTKVSG